MMSTQRGNANRTRCQKYKNRTAFKNDLHDKTPQQIRLNAMHVSTVCQRCKEVIEWKIKYKKYKPLSQPKCCTKCHQRTVRKAYHVICRDCAIKDKVCAKCLKGEEEVSIEAPEPTPREQQQLRTEMDRLIKTFSERKRRAFLRYMEKGKKEKEQAEKLADEHSDEDEDAAEKDEQQQQHVANELSLYKRVPHTREELLRKIQQLQIATEEDFEDDDDDDDYDDEEDEEDEDEEDEDEDEDCEQSNDDDVVEEDAQKSAQKSAALK